MKKNKFTLWLHWIAQRPLAIVNLIGIIIIFVGFSGFFIFQATRDINVLDDWTIETSNARVTRVVEGTPVSAYKPGDSLVFTSQSVKVADAKGTIVRSIVCEATADQEVREIQLDTIPASRPAGKIPKRENAIVIPDVVQFEKLPRWCKLVIDITYENVHGTGRSQAEHAESDRFLVEEAVLDPAAIRRQVQEFEKRIEDLERQLNESGAQIQPTPTVTPQNAAPITPQQVNPPVASNPPLPTQPATPAQPADDRSALGRLPVVGVYWTQSGYNQNHKEKNMTEKQPDISAAAKRAYVPEEPIEESDGED